MLHLLSSESGIYGIWEVGGGWAAGGRNWVLPMGWPVVVALDKALAGMPTKVWSSNPAVGRSPKVSGKHDGGVRVLGVPGGKLFIVSNCFNRLCAYLGTTPEGNGTPLQDSHLENPMDRGPW